MSENLPIGSNILQVSANDADEGSNAKITYSINRKQSDKNELFKIDANNGLLTVNKILNFERQTVHEIGMNLKYMRNSTIINTFITKNSAFFDEIFF